MRAKLLGRTLEQQLSMGVAVGLLVFTVAAGMLTAAFAYRHQLNAAKELQNRLIATVQAQTEVAAFALNEDIAREVIGGLLANPQIKAVRIKAHKNHTILASGGIEGAFATADAVSTYPLRSPVDRASEIGTIEIAISDEKVAEQVWESTQLLLGVIFLQVVLAASLIVWVSRRIILRPITALASRMANIVPGSGVRLAIPEAHENDEIGQLSHSANALIDAHEQALAELRELATVDALTGAFNRRHFRARMDDELARLQRNETLKCVVLMVDIDHFKEINDTWGHAVGDKALSHLGIILRSNARKIDVVGRLGGEEFAILLVDIALPEAVNLSERLRQSVANTPVAHDGKLISMTLSIGVAAATSTDRDADGVLARADAALYQAKQQGRNRVVTS